MEITFKTKAVKEKFLSLRDEWEGCTECPLCESRTYMVHFRGRMPCDLLMIGEAPGLSEDRIGYPFVGEAGHLLKEALDFAPVSVRWGICNMVACLPLGDDGKIRQPKGKEMQSCRPRLAKLIELSNPKVIVFLGRTAEKAELAIGGLVKQKKIQKPELFQSPHPASVLYKPDKERPIEFKRIVQALRKANAVCLGEDRTKMV